MNKHWLTPWRVRTYSRILLLFFVLLAFFLGRYAASLEAKGHPLLSDFTIVWVTAHLGWSDHPEAAYDNATQQQAFAALSEPQDQGRFGLWLYPPVFYLAVLPLAFLPYWLAFLVYSLTTLSFYVAALRRWIKHREALWVLAAFPGLWINGVLGQNGFLTAGLAAAALLALPRRPVLSGVLIGCLCIKPQLGLLFPVALIAIGAWRTIVAAALTVAGLLLAAFFVFGVATYDAWLHSFANARTFLQTAGPAMWGNMPTFFSFARLLGAPVSVAYALQAVVALAAVATVWVIWRRNPSWMLRSAALVAATFLITPYVFNYDLTWLALALAALVRLGSQEGWLSGEREVLVGVWLLPLLVIVVARFMPLQIGPFVLLLLLGMIVRRHRAMMSEGTITPG
jgi:hypothetical protein